MHDLLISFFGDDFTGSTDAVESLSLAGLRTVLFTAPPTPAQIERYSGLRAYGIAGTTRAQPPGEMEQTLRPAFEAMRQIGAPIVHYKVCSTFDSSPTIGSIGRAIDVGSSVFEQNCVPVLVGAPSLGRYCAFGNLFARAGAESEPFRLDRHPSMSRHPTTPMAEADLRLHLAKQTARSIGLLDVVTLESKPDIAGAMFDSLMLSHGAVLVDLLLHGQLAKAGALINRGVEPGKSHFVVGSSGVGEALCAHWRLSNVIPIPLSFPRAAPADGPIIVLCGSCSPVTAGQIAFATENGFANIPVDVRASIDSNKAIAPATKFLRESTSIILHTSGATLPDQRLQPAIAAGIGPRLGKVLREILIAHPASRVVIAGGDTSGQIARSLDIESMEMIATLTRGSPLMRVTAPASPADGIEMTFKGGQIGAVDFFLAAKNGN